MQNKWYSVFKATIGPLLWVWNRPKATGLEYIPDEGPAILASSHESVMDSFYKPLVVDRQMQFPAKSEYFTTPGLVGRVQAWFFNSAGQIPVDRTADDAGDATLKAARTVLGAGHLFSIYPEGTRSPDGRVYKGRTGMARIAMATGAPVIPVAMHNTRKANPIGTWLPRPVKVGLTFGEAIDPHAWAEQHGYDPSSREVNRPFTDHVMHTIARMADVPYVDMYANDVKESLAAGNGYPTGSEPGGTLETRF